MPPSPGHETVGPAGRNNDGGGERDRTDDPLLAKQVLSQLSYTPVSEDRNQESGISRSCVLHRVIAFLIPDP